MRTAQGGIGRIEDGIWRRQFTTRGTVSRGESSLYHTLCADELNELRVA